MLTSDEILDRYIKQPDPPEPKVPDTPKIKNDEYLFDYLQQINKSCGSTNNSPEFLKVELEENMFQWATYLVAILNINGDKIGARRILHKEDKFRYEETASILASDLLSVYKTTLEKLILPRLYQLNPPNHVNPSNHF